MKPVKNFLYLTSFIILIMGCDSVDFKKTKGGMPYKLYASKSGKKVENGKFAKMQVSQKIKDSVVFTSYTGMPIYFQVNPSTQTYDPSEIFASLKEGDSLYTVQMIDTFIKRNPAIVQQTKFRNGDKITTTFKILKVFDNADEYKKDEDLERTSFTKKEESTVKDYLSKNKVNAQRTGTGTYVQIQNAGSGPQADSGKYVSVLYKGQTFSGKVFDTNMDTSFKHTEPMGFTVGTGQMIKGFDEGIRLLKKGGKARIFMPSSLGYAGQPPSPDIKPFEHLIFDVEVLDVLNVAPAQPGMPAPPDTSGRNQ
jgi:FKBP-type peptidyl-prolyl cis-trans isomerase